MEFVQLILHIGMFGGFLTGVLLTVDWYSYGKIDLEMEMRAKVLQDLLHTPAEQRSTRVLDLWFLAVADSLLSKESHSNKPVAKPEDFNTLELRLHLAERITESEGLHGKIAIGARELDSIDKDGRKKVCESNEKVD